MGRPRVEIFAAIALATMLVQAPPARSLDSNGLIQNNISTASIAGNGQRYIVDMRMLATDVEQMFLKTGREREGVDLAQPGAIEREIGAFIASRVTMRDGQGADCARKIEKSGEDPANDEGVLVELSFACATAGASYDPTRLLAAQSPRAWQVVTIARGEAKRQIMVNGESPPVAMLEAP
ncbi:hypothetical protein [Methylocystis bryophila]|uniref:Uncharacterized protein n=1 Tax=Methylocystis bryophila TaxID=655015 RepID=A0A1W6MWB8_9HYPH|nr:hypothetical protein [Methylocystis bryophila]ARN81888.1 hypothetical protein B1812_13230 [Methylocystis bryophila]BDV37969.1 hypothetical protein DSM21852_12220 [Methylocystis bryophila]